MRGREREQKTKVSKGGRGHFHFDMGGHFAPVLLSPPSPPSPSPVLKVTGMRGFCGVVIIRMLIGCGSVG